MNRPPWTLHPSVYATQRALVPYHSIGAQPHTYRPRVPQQLPIPYPLNVPQQSFYTYTSQHVPMTFVRDCMRNVRDEDVSRFTTREEFTQYLHCKNLLSHVFVYRLPPWHITPREKADSQRLYQEFEGEVQFMKDLYLRIPYLILLRARW